MSEAQPLDTTGLTGLHHVRDRILNVLRSLRRRFRRPSQWRALLRLPRYQPGSFRLRPTEATVEYVDAASCASALRAIFEHQIYAFHAESSSPRIIDCGANIGLAVLYWKQKFPGARITAFEPDPAVYETLSRNIEGWGLRDVELLRSAVGGEPGQALFLSEGADAGCIVRESRENAPRAKPLIAVDVVALAPFLREPVDLLKIDIEGAETDLLLGLVDQLHHVRRIFVEWHSFTGEPQHLHTILGILVNAGFRVHCQPEFSLSSPFLEVATTAPMDNRVNVFAMRL